MKLSVWNCRFGVDEMKFITLTKEELETIVDIMFAADEDSANNIGAKLFEFICQLEPCEVANLIAVLKAE